MALIWLQRCSKYRLWMSNQHFFVSQYLAAVDTTDRYKYHKAQAVNICYSIAIELNMSGPNFIYSPPNLKN